VILSPALLYQPASHGVKNGLKPVVSAELLIDRVKVISQGRQRDAQFVCDLPRVLRLGKEHEDALLLV
jgi:hypothetical protein